ncbi:MAG TPA: ATP-binding protein [Spirochaetota bacterium]|nr:ATP-binding protein [Spirochaetota bacterium]HNT09369.1 ATP-binding protein [Spirochaetota bacterium]HNV46770.1 ATP-binding protein [Spirochaetota bacterium]HPU87146.1 ATP-binding protein [Spirochaetota bacterium]
MRAPSPMNRNQQHNDAEPIDSIRRRLAHKGFIVFPAVGLGLAAAGAGAAAYAVPAREAAVIVVLIALSALALAGTLAFVIASRRRISDALAKIEEELSWKGILMEHSNELVVILNPYGQITAVNRNVADLLHLERGAIIGKPFREIVYDEKLDRNLRLNDMILRKLGEVFSGRETDLTCFSKNRGTNEIVTINYRLVPIFTNERFEHILAVGRVIQGDLLSSRYLMREFEYYRLDNNISLVFQLCMRLTRNLEGRLPKNQVLMAQVGLQEVLINSIEHGNLEIDYHMKTRLKSREGNYWELLVQECDQDHLRERKVHVSYTLEPDRVVYTIRDEGAGFDWRRFLERTAEDIDQELMANLHGLGIQFARTVFDISFNEAGNEVHLSKSFS